LRLSALISRLKMSPSSTAFREIIDSLPQIVWTSPPNNWPDYFNQRWFDYTGLQESQGAEVNGQGPQAREPRSELSGQSSEAEEQRTDITIHHPSLAGPKPSEGGSSILDPPPWHSLIHPDDLTGFMGEWEAALRAEVPFGLMLRLRRAADWQFRWHLARGNPMRSAEGQITCWVGTLTDVEDRVEAEENLKQSAAELARSNAELAQFASVVSHDLQEPPRQVASVIQILLEHREALNPETAKWLAVAHGGAKRMQLLINGLLDYARLGTKLKPFVPVDCTVAYETAVAKLNSKIQECGAVLTAGPLPHLRGDESALSRLFENLLDNAIKFKSTEPPKIRVLAERFGKEWLFKISDNGV